MSIILIKSQSEIQLLRYLILKNLKNCIAFDAHHFVIYLLNFTKNEQI